MTTPEYRQPTHREELERELVHGAATHIASEPHHAGAIAEAIKTVLDTLYPIAATPTSGPDNAHAAAVLYPAIERAMGELSKLHEGFNMEVNRAFNILHDAFWSECPAPASAVPKRRETADAEHQPKADNGPRVTPFEVEAHIRSEFYFTAEQGVLGESELGTRPASWTNLDQVTICVLILKNGTKIVGVNEGPVSRENFKADLGRQYARQKAVDQIWPLLGFRLRDELARPVLTDADAAADLAGKPRPDNPTAEAADFLASVKACDLSGDAPCEACQ